LVGLFIFCIVHTAPLSTLFPYTTLFRSDDLADAVREGDEGQRLPRVVLPLDHEQVAVVERGGPHLDDRLPGPRRGIGALAHPEVLEPEGLHQLDDAHDVVGPPSHPALRLQRLARAPASLSGQAGAEVSRAGWRRASTRRAPGSPSVAGR